MKLYQMKYLLSVCRTHSISKAADELAVSRPAVSRAIRELEEEFALPFFQRTTTGVELTEAGSTFYEKCVKVDRLLTELEAEMGAIRSNTAGENSRQLRLGISFTARCCLLPFLTSFQRAYPDVQLRSTELEESFLDCQTLQPNFDVEIAICPDREIEGIGYINVEDSSLAFCCSRDHPLAGRSSVSIQEIADEPLIGLYHLEQQSNQMTGLYERHGLHPNVVHITQQVAFLRQMIRDGLGTSVKPPQSMENDPDIATVPILESEKFYLRILWNETVRHNSAFHDFISYALRAFPAQQPDGGETD